MKKIVALILVLIMAFALASEACAGTYWNAGANGFLGPVSGRTNFTRGGKGNPPYYCMQ